MLILVSAAVDDVRYRASNGGEKAFSHAAVAVRMGISRSSFSETWAQSYEHIVKFVFDLAMSALTEVELLINELNSKERHFGWAPILSFRY